jgi:hypothetical protein
MLPGNMLSINGRGHCPASLSSWQFLRSLLGYPYYRQGYANLDGI